MNNIISISAMIAFLLAGNAQVSAQEIQDAKGLKVSRIGLKGGVNFSDLYTSDSDKDKILFGFNAGLFAKLPITKFLAVQPELYFISKGAELTYNNAFVNGVARFRYNY